MAIAAALNVLVTSPSEQLKNDLKKHGLTVQQFNRTITKMYGDASKSARDDIYKMSKAVDVAFKQSLLSDQEKEKGLRILRNAYDYVAEGGENFAAMLKDSEAIMARQNIETGQTVNRLKQLEAMFKAGQISARAFGQELKSMTASIKTTANFGPQVAAIAARQVKPESTFAQGRRALDRAWITGAITDTKDYNKELSRLRSNLENATGVTGVNVEAERKRKNDQLADEARIKKNLDDLDRRRKQTEEEALGLNQKHRTAREEYNDTIRRANELALNGANAAAVDLEKQEAARAMLERDGTFARFARAEAANDSAANDVKARRNALLAEGAVLNKQHISHATILANSQSKLNNMLAQGAITQHTYNMEMAAANALYKQNTSLISKLGFSMHGFKAAAGLFNPWLALTVGAGLAVKTGMEFEKSMDRVQALAGATGAEIRQLTDYASELGRSTVFSAKQAAEGMAALAKASFKTEDIMNAMAPTLQLAAIGEMEVGDAAEITARIMAGMKIPATDVADVIDSIAVASTNSVNTVEQLGEALKFVGPAAQQAGMELDEVMASLMILGNAGMSGELGGTALRNIFFRMAKQTDEAKEALEELGVTFRGMDGNILPMLDIIKQFEESMEGLSTGDKLMYFNKIFQTRSATGFAALVGAGSEQMEEMLRLQNERMGLATRLEKQLNDNLMGDLELFGSTVSGIATDLYDSGIGPVLRFLANTLTFTVKVLELFGNSIKIAAQAVMTSLVGLAYGFVSLMNWLQPVETDSMKRVREALGNFASEGIDEMAKTSDKMAKIIKDGNEASYRAVGAGTPGEDIKGKIKQNEEEQKAAQERAEQMHREAQAALEANQRAEKFIETLKGTATVSDEIAKRHQTLADILLSEAATSHKIKSTWLVLDKTLFPNAEAIAKKWQEAKNDAMSVGMSSGQQHLLSVGDQASGMDKMLAKELDRFDVMKQLNERLQEAQTENERLQLDSDLGAIDPKHKSDRWTDILREQYDLFNKDGKVTSDEKKEYDRLAVIVKQNRELEKQIKLRDEANSKLKTDAGNMKKSAEELKKQFDPMIGFKEEFTKLSVMKGAGLIGDKTFNDAVTNLENETLKKAGPRNIGYAGAVEAGSAEAYSASLAKISNPEFDELKRQTALAKESVGVQRDIRRGIEAQKKGDQLQSID